MSLHTAFFFKRVFKPTCLALCLSALLFCAACAVDGGLSLSPTEALTALDLRNSGVSDVSDLLRQTQLESLDLRGNSISIEDYAALHAALPDCSILWSVPVGNERVDSTATELTLPDPSAEQIDVLRFFPDLKTVRFESASDGDAMRALSGQYPDVRFSWDVTLFDTVYPSDTTALDLSGQTVDLASLPAALSLLPDLSTVTFGEESFALADQLALADAFPAVSFVWNVQLLDDLIVRSDVTELDLRDYAVPDAAALGEKLPLLPALTYLDMCGCGPDDEAMVSLRAQYPAVKFVWYTHVAGWIIRTDIKGFSTGNRVRFPDGAGWYAAEKFKYSMIKAADLEHLQYCTDLVALDIGHCGIVNLEFLRLLPKLKYLDIALGDYVDLTPLESQPDLIYLQMMYNCVEDISPLAACEKLRFLNISNNVIQNADVLMNMQHLERLWMNCSGLTDEQIAEVEAALPNTVIKASQTNPEYAMSLWCKGNEGYVTVQALYGLRAKYQ